MCNQRRINDYDLEPVKYCGNCYSLRIVGDENLTDDYCTDCGSSNVLICSINDWESLYKERYGHRYVEKNYDYKKNPIFKMSLSELKTEVYKNPLLDKIIHKMYPRFPGGLSREESVLLLFDRLIRDNKIEDLKLILLNYKNNGREEIKRNSYESKT